MLLAHAAVALHLQRTPPAPQPKPLPADDGCRTTRLRYRATTLLVMARTSPLTFSMSSWNLRMTFSVLRTSSGSRLSACSSSRVRAQSMVSDMAGAFFRSRSRSSWMKANQLPAQFRRNVRYAGMNDALLQVDVGERNVEVQAAPLQRIGRSRGCCCW